MKVVVVDIRKRRQVLVKVRVCLDDRVPLHLLMVREFVVVLSTLSHFEITHIKPYPMNMSHFLVIVFQLFLILVNLHFLLVTLGSIGHLLVHPLVLLDLGGGTLLVLLDLVDTGGTRYLLAAVA